MHLSHVKSYENLSFAFLSLVLWTFFMASSAPTPLYLIYQQQWGFSSIALTLIFSMYAIGMLSALFTVGSLSDYLGRKPVVAGAIILELVSMIIFLQADSLTHLLFARFIQGCATGMATAVLGAFLLDINSDRATIATSVIPLLATGAGVALSSLSVDFGPMPLQLIYALIAIGLAFQLVGVHMLNESISKRPLTFKALRPSLAIPASAKATFLAIMPMNIAVWSLNGFFLSLVPSLVKASISTTSTSVGGIVVSLLSFSGAMSVVLLRRKRSDYTNRLGIILLVIGVAGILGGVYSSKTYIYYTSTIIAGFGVGACIISMTKELLPLALPFERASLISAYWVASQLSLIVPSILVGILVHYAGLTIATYYYGAVVLLLLVISPIVMSRRLKTIS
ncbi:MFS transporter [Pseudomonas lactucae]|nr:MFS transporter [Pseudomonas lactucae]